MQSDYRSFIDRMIHKYEGGYGWDQKDPGGPTKYGITCYDLAEHRGQNMDSMERWAPLVRAMELQEAEDIYHTKYAGAIMFDMLPAGVDCCMMDYAVNSGIGRAVAVASAMCNMHSSHVGPNLMAAIKAYDPTKFVDTMCEERLGYMHRIRQGTAWEEFGRGWQARVDDLKAYCHGLVTGTVTNVPAPNVPSAGKAVHPDPDVSKHIKAVTGGGAATGAAAGYAGAPWWVVVLATGIIAAVGAAIYLHKQRQADNANKVVLHAT